MRSMTTVIVLLLGAMFAVCHAAGEEEMSFKDGMNAVWKGHFNNLVKVIDGDLRECDLMIATPEADDAKTVDLWVSATASQTENYKILLDAALVDGQFYLDGLASTEYAKRAVGKAALAAARKWKEAYDHFLFYVVRGDSIMAMSFVRNANRAQKESEAMRDGAAGVFSKLRDLVGKADEELGKIEVAIGSAGSRKELDDLERELLFVTIWVRNARIVLKARKTLAEAFFSDKTYKELEELLLKARDRYTRAEENKKLEPVLAKHLKHLDLWKKLLIERWKSWNSAFAEAEQKWKPFMQQALFESLPRFKGVPYDDLEKPVESVLKLIEERRREIR